MDINPALIQKYTTQGPRYTSYPPVPHWQELSSPIPYLEQNTSCEPYSLYVHIPFCPVRCLFCGCNVAISKNLDRYSTYVELLSREFTLITGIPSRPKLSQLHWGGGTPNALPLSQTESLFSHIESAFEILPDAEISIECDPRNLSRSQLELYRKLGFNRISFGVQDFDQAVQEAIGRFQSVEETENAVTWARKLGFGGINIDLIYGLPKQNTASFQKTLHEIRRLRPDRLALYSFAYVPWVKPHQKAILKDNLPRAEEKIDLFLQALEFLLNEGFCYIGLDHFARPEDELTRALAEKTLWRNFMGYTPKKTGALIGTGVSGISMTENVYTQNVMAERDYARFITEKKLPQKRGLVLGRDDKIRRDVVQSLMCYGEADLQQVAGSSLSPERYFSDALLLLKELEDDGLIEVEGLRLRVLEQGKLFTRNIAIVFDAYYQKQEKLYSSTI